MVARRRKEAKRVRDVEKEKKMEDGAGEPVSARKYSR